MHSRRGVPIPDGSSSPTPYSSTKTHSSKSSSFLSNGFWSRMLMFFMTIGYVGLFYYFKTTSSVRALETNTAVKVLETSIASLESKMKEAARELKERKAAFEEKGKELQAKTAALMKAENKIAAFQKVKERLSENNLVQALQKQNLAFNTLRWGEGPRRILLTMEGGGEIELETAPFDVMPHALHWFMTLVETGFWDGCHIIRNAHHVIQLNCNGRVPRHKRQPSIVFQEYSEQFNHLPFTCGIAGRPGGPDWYFNLVDNIGSHGPGGQGPEADPCFATIIRGKELIQDFHKKLGNEFLQQEEYVKIISARILDEGGAALAAEAVTDA